MRTLYYRWNLRLKASVPIASKGTATFSRRFLLLLFILFSLSSPSFALTQNHILNIESAKIGDYAEITVNTSQKTRPEMIKLEGPSRIALVFHNSRIDAPMMIESRSPLINMIQAMQFDENTVYVMIEPKEELSYEFTSFIGRNKVMLELSKARPGSKKRIAPSPAEKKVAEVPNTYQIITEGSFVPEIITEEAEEQIIEISIEVQAMPPAKPVVLPKKIKLTELPVKEIKEVRGIKEIAPIPGTLKGVVIVIDPGHGGRDPGYVGRSGIMEKALTYKIALNLKKLLDAAGAKTIFTRTGDVEIKNRNIVRLANAKNADMFIAIHLNSFTTPRINGCETFYFTPKSRNFANTMQKNLSRTIKMRSRGVKRETYYTIHHTRMPAILVETGYLTNPTDEKKILTLEFRRQIALGIYKGIVEYAKINKYGRNNSGSPRSI
jgi:N-acetylmuramoyl-L-alanine amidase